MKNKCDWCEERRNEGLLHIMNKEQASFAIDFDDYDGFPCMDIIRKSYDDVIWETQFTIRINYCPFCGRKLGDEDEEN